MSTLSSTLACALELSAADRATLMHALRAADAGLDLDPSSVRASSDADVRALCGRPAPWDNNRRVTARVTDSAIEFELTPRHLELLAEATARLTTMVGTRITAE